MPERSEAEFKPIASSENDQHRLSERALATKKIAKGQPEPISVTVRTACQLTGLGPTKLYELLAAGAIKSSKVGNRRLLEYQSLKQLVMPVGAEAA